ncbi:phage tail family protein [Staphylococcus xylosus]|uniref:phage tail domain-containing protein n=1 Tax=Staphylococcus xylosus TaxID=1288 RepID=UPI001C1E0293|nr:phage tail domain-containing protein [Staphylococcus xylosus]MBU6132144.1 phage tail family protein [Staphylococcus xylosus]MEB8150465.1 phage tail family protein [Staphylococcus xylosus]
MNKRVRFFNDKESYYLDEVIPRIRFLDATEEDVETNVNSLEIKGTDGVMMGPSTFGPFKLILRFSYIGEDITDYKLVKTKLRNLLYQRNPYYVVHSDMPGKKYAVYCENNAIEDLTSKFGTFEMTFQVYKGYSESLYKTDQYSLISDKWQFESGVMPDAEIKYKHTRQKFSIYNGSSDTINPRKRHQLQIWIRLKTTTGFKLVNKTTGDVFEYKGKLETNQSFLIDGAYPYIEKERCGRLTNHGLITLAPGYNDFEIWGTVSDFEIQFIFSFIYR